MTLSSRGVAPISPVDVPTGTKTVDPPTNHAGAPFSTLGSHGAHSYEHPGAGAEHDPLTHTYGAVQSAEVAHPGAGAEHVPPAHTCGGVQSTLVTHPGVGIEHVPPMHSCGATQSALIVQVPGLRLRALAMNTAATIARSTSTPTPKGLMVQY
jgi:hypothetical protein